MINTTSIANTLKSLGMIGVAVSLGSCTTQQFTDKSVHINYQLTISDDDGQLTCKAFSRSNRLGHHKPSLPKNVNPAKLSSDEMNEILLTYAEEIQHYIDRDEKYLAEDIAKHLETCK